jgi:hypothetical protein
LINVLHEVKPNEIGDKKKININTEETEEKDEAIKMLQVFIDELGHAYINFVPDTSKLMISMVQYEANMGIR